MQESCKVSGKRGQGAKAKDMRTFKRYRNDLAKVHGAEAQGKIVNKLPTVEMSKELINKRMSPF